jgi:hypothetical protein
MIQEICAARHLKISYGDHLFSESLFQNIFINPFHSPTTLSQVPLAISIRYMSPNSRTLWNLLSLTKSHQSSDRRDKVIALLGVATDLDDEVRYFLADFTKDEIDTWQFTLMYFLLTAIGLAVPGRMYAGIEGKGLEYNWKKVLGNSASNFPDDQDESVINIYRACKCGQDMETSDIATESTSASEMCARGQQVAQIGSFASISLLSSLWKILHTILDPTSSTSPFASVSHPQ